MLFEFLKRKQTQQEIHEPGAMTITTTGDEEQVQVFASEFGSIRVVSKGGDPWFVASDVCNALDIANSRDAVKRLDDDEKGVVSTDTPGGKQEVTTVSESGLYSLVLSSRKPEAKAFKRWVTHEVIPAIRKHGAYMTATTIDSIIADPASFVKLAQALADEREKAAALSVQNAKLVEVNGRLEWENDGLSQKIEADAPKVRFAESFRDADGCVSIAELAKLLCERGYQTGEVRLFETLRDEGFLCKAGHDRNHPAQRYLDMAKPIFVLRASFWEGEDGKAHQYTKTMVTPAGITYFLHHFCGESFRLGEGEARRTTKKGRSVPSFESQSQKVAAIIQRAIDAHPGEKKFVVIEQIKSAIPEISEEHYVVVGKALKLLNVEEHRKAKGRFYKMPASLFDGNTPAQSSSRANRVALVKAIITDMRGKGASDSYMTSSQFLAQHREELGDMSVPQLESVLRDLCVKSNTTYGVLCWKLPA